MPVYNGQCHCGAIGFEYVTEIPPSQWSLRACQCSFCRAHGAECTSDPAGTVTFRVGEAASLQHYRFGLQTADFLICRNCGVYIGAKINAESEEYATLNVRAITTALVDIPAAVPTDYQGEPSEERLDRRKTQWTPVARSF